MTTLFVDEREKRLLQKAELRRIGAPRVVHCKQEKFDIYIGRPSKWGNQFKIGTDGTREQVIEKYREWIMRPEQGKFRADAKKELRGKVLGCWCFPHQSCHGDILVSISNE